MIQENSQIQTGSNLMKDTFLYHSTSLSESHFYLRSKMGDNKRTCEFCSKEFEPHHHGKNPRFCGRKCAAKYRGERRIKNLIMGKCAYCGKEYDTEYHRRDKYCSRKCMSLGFKKHKFCLVCGKETKTKNKYCSRRCFGITTQRQRKAICPICNKEFMALDSRGTKYCGKKCLAKSLRVRIRTKCFICSKVMFVVPSRLKNKKDVFCSYHCRNLYITKLFKRNGCKDTSIEIKIQKELDKRGVNYKKQFRVSNIAVVDLFLEPNIVIQCDGNYWHNLPNRKEKDKLQNEKLLANGFRLYRFSEGEINESAKKCIDKIYP